MSFNSKIYIIHLNGKTSRKQIRKYVCVYSSPYYIQITLYSYVFLWHTLFLMVFKVCNVRPLLTLLTSYTLLTVGHVLPYLGRGRISMVRNHSFLKMRSCIISTQLFCIKTLFFEQEHWFNILTDLQWGNTTNSTISVFW